MANIKSARKRARQNIVRKARNTARRSAIKTAEKKIMTALQEGVSLVTIKDLLRDAESQISRAVGKTLHKNTASRKVSRLAKKVAQLEKSA
jgi:small subunit ribosomal protein S20